VILLAHPTANQNVRQAALALAEVELLSEFWTCINWRQNGIVDSLCAITPGLRNQFRRRSFPPEITPFIHTHAFREWGRQLAGHLDWEWLIRSERAPFNIDKVYRSLDRRIAQRLSRGLPIKAVYGYDGGALETFRQAKKRGILCIYEHPIVYWRVSQELQREEAELRPEWASTLVGLSDSQEKLARKDKELALADVVITPSTFAKESLATAGRLSAPVKVVPYGGDAAPATPLDRPKGQRLRALFVGALTQAKGLGYLLDAVKTLGDRIELTLIGRRVSPSMPRREMLERTQWIPSLAHHELLREMTKHDVLVLPSLNEGFGLVLAEAMAQGLTVIATSHTAGPDLFTDGIEGFLVPIRSAEALVEKLFCLDRERDRLKSMQEAAYQRAMSNSWKNYRQRLTELAREVVARSPVS
jgi:glycosyltransferase involved in cell wall biosynthesis